jgi:hypothetical protein
MRVCDRAPRSVLKGILELTPVYDVDFKVGPRSGSERGYLAFVGLVYLGIGLFVCSNSAELPSPIIVWSLLSLSATSTLRPWSLKPTG